MKAKDISGKAPGGKRTVLADELPLSTPYVVQIFPVYACNFACRYCIFSTGSAKRGFISDKKIMDFELYKRCVDDSMKFPDKVRTFRIVGIGEPLLHKNIVDMISYAAEKKIARTIEIVTNASLLTPDLSDSLIAAGLSRLVVSIQGTSQEKYRQTCGANIEFEGFVGNLRYFYEHRKKTQVYIKIVDCALDDKDDEKKFYEIFGDICDTIAIENVVPIHSGVDYRGILRKKTLLTQFGLPVSDVRVCPQPFFSMQINPDGKVVPCFSFEYPMIMGDCNKESVPDIWNGERFRLFRRAMLDGLGKAGKTCENCQIIKYRLFPEDDLDDHAEKLKRHYGDTYGK